VQGLLPPTVSRGATSRRGYNGARTVLPEPSYVDLHGHRACYRIAGEGPVIALTHGITSTSEVWREVIGPLSERFV
jgi:pimeloyl-ACP methyl ester carboxylesterase